LVKNKELTSLEETKKGIARNRVEGIQSKWPEKTLIGVGKHIRGSKPSVQVSWVRERWGKDDGRSWA
jgi:hypothetical protein